MITETVKSVDVRILKNLSSDLPEDLQKLILQLPDDTDFDSFVAKAEVMVALSKEMDRKRS